MTAPAHRPHHLPRADAAGGSGTSAPTCCPRSTPTPSRRAGGVPVLLPPVDQRRRGGRRGRPARRAGDQRRRRRRPGPVRRRAAPAHRRLAAGPGRLGARRCSTPPTPPALPVLGVCRGMQVMAVHAGGRLDQHTPDLVGHERAQPGRRRVRRGRGVDRRPAAGSPTLVGDRAHGQLPPPPVGARRTPGSWPSAHAADGTLEAMEAPRRPVLRRRAVAPRDRRRRRACWPGWCGPRRRTGRDRA